MGKRREEAQKWIKNGDDTYNAAIQDVNRYFKVQQYLDFTEEQANKNRCASKLALSCEYYLKGLLLENAKIPLSPEIRQLLFSVTGSDKLTEEEEIALILGTDKDIQRDGRMNDSKYARLKVLNTNMIMENGQRINALKSLQRVLKEQYLSFLSISHDLGKAIESVDSQIGKKIIAMMAIMDGNVNWRDTEAISAKKEFADYIFQGKPISSENYFLKQQLEQKMRDIVNSEEVKNAFPSGRYGHLHADETDIFEGDVKSLMRFVRAIRRVIPNLMENVVDVTNLLQGTNEFIFPDYETDIEVLGENDKIVYRCERDEFVDGPNTPEMPIMFQKTKVVNYEEKGKYDNYEKKVPILKTRSIIIKNKYGFSELNGENLCLSYICNGRNVARIHTRDTRFDARDVSVLEELKLQRERESDFEMSESERIKSLESRVKTLEQEKRDLKGKKDELEEKVSLLQSMLNRTLKFAERVKMSRIGKIFFGKDIKALDSPENNQQGREL